MPPGTQMLIALVSDLGSLGFILWMTHRLTTNTIPRLAGQFEVATKEQRKDFKEMLKDQADAHQALLKEQREMFEERAKREEQLFLQTTERLASAIERQPPPIRLKGGLDGDR